MVTSDGERNGFRNFAKNPVGKPPVTDGSGRIKLDGVFEGPELVV